MNINTKLLITTAVSIISFTYVSAQISVFPSTEFDPNDRGPFFADSNGNLLPAGNEVRIGFFETEFDFMSAANDLEALLENFVTFDSGVIELGAFSGRLGALNFQEFNRGSQETEPFRNQQIHMFVFQTNTNSMVTTLDSIVGYGIFSGPTTGDDPWVFANDSSSNQDQFIFTGDINEFVAGSLVSGPDYDMLVLIPESKVYAAIFGLLSLGFALYRRRKPTV